MCGCGELTAQTLSDGHSKDNEARRAPGSGAQSRTSSPPQERSGGRLAEPSAAGATIRGMPGVGLVGLKR